MREPNYRSFWPATIILIWILAAVFLLQSFALRFASWGPDLYHDLSLTRNAITSGHLWQLLTFQFLHAPWGYGGLMHILFNCLFLWMFGTAVEGELGKGGFLRLYFFTGTAGGLFHILGNLFAPAFFGSPVVGASAGVSGVIAAFAILMPHASISVWGLFPITGRTLLIIQIVFSVLGILFDRGRVAHGAHLGGLLSAFVYLRWMRGWELRMPSFKMPKRKPRVINGGVRSYSPPPPEASEVNTAEVDAILDKIHAHGIQSLTDLERKKLEAARSKLAKR